MVGLPHTGDIELCRVKLDAETVANYKMLIEQDFKYRLYADGLPSATVVSKNEQKHTQVLQYHEGIPVGEINIMEGDEHIYNHLEITIKLHKVAGSKDRNRVVGFDVEPKSIGCNKDGPDASKKAELKVGEEILFTYSIRTVWGKGTDWSHRMDHYTKINSHYEQVYHS